ncbi:hypothetical protein [Acinetobacter johnsonii]|uniref:hypothetical protein n=1 Tax=Acinetobacter johnsonii TaxID=40214 RepID=UPI0030087394
MNFEKYNAFIDEQKIFFKENIKPNFKWEWTDPEWAGGVIGSGWLLSRSGKTRFSFQATRRMKGINDIPINIKYQEFIKAVMVLSYRKANSKTSPQKLYAEVLIIKRWFSELFRTNPENTHPCFLSTLTLENSFKILAENSNKANLPDHAGTYLRLQQMLNHYGFTEQPLEFSQKYLYINSINRTPNAKKTKALIDQLELDEDDLNKEKLISIQTFINIVSLISLCKTNGEKIVLNLLLLLIITGLRSTEVILLKTDALIKKPILDPVTQKHLTLDGIKQYTLGIQYHGAKGAGYRIHWVEPSSVKLVESIFKSVLELTSEYRSHLNYIRSKGCKDYFPKSIDDIMEDYLEIDDLINTIFSLKEYKSGRAGQRATVTLNLNKVSILRSEKNGVNNKRYYLKKDIDAHLKSLIKSNLENPIDYVFNYEGKIEKIAYEDLLFIHEYRSINMGKDFIFKSLVVPFSVIMINNFLGARSVNSTKSVFQKYNLLETESEHSRLTSHIPRHNINTFLALSGLAEHLQAMLMGRVDIKQNQYYHHLALKQRKVAASMLEKYDLMSPSVVNQAQKTDSPIDAIKQDGLLFFSEQLDLENNLKMNLQTFDSKIEVSNYLKDSFFDEYFQDIAESFNELIKEDQTLANSLVQRHACLHPLPFGGCMREVAVHDCPKRLACQSGDQCGNFALTGRKGELEVLQHTLNNLLVEFEYIEQIVAHDSTYTEMLAQFRQKIHYLRDLKEKALDRQNKLIPIPVFPYGDTITKLPTTLSELFAIEQQKIESKES